MKKNSFSVWQITFPICVLGIATITLLAGVYLSSGKYEFKFNATREGLNIETHVNK
jgi:hypothetical protein